MEKKLSVLGIALAKPVLHLVGMDAHGKGLVRKRLARSQLMAYIAPLPPVVSGLEAWGGTHN
jgi:transposase